MFLGASLSVSSIECREKRAADILFPPPLYCIAIIEIWRTTTSKHITPKAKILFSSFAGEGSSYGSTIFDERWKGGERPKLYFFAGRTVLLTQRGEAFYFQVQYFYTRKGNMMNQVPCSTYLRCEKKTGLNSASSPRNEFDFERLRTVCEAHLGFHREMPVFRSVPDKNVNEK